MSSSYIGRFAPSPSGPLHFGSLISALISYLDARAHQGKWLLRIEDLDPPREKVGAAVHIQTGLERLGLFWDGPVMQQSLRLPAYQQALSQLQQQDLCFACDCSRKQLPWRANYPGYCRGKKTTNKPSAIRIKAAQTQVIVSDFANNHTSINIASHSGDFIVLRKDQLFSYQLAVTVDDAYQNITHVVRGRDLEPCAPRQNYLCCALNLPSPRYMHHALAMQQPDLKLSKSAQGFDISAIAAEQLLFQALCFIGLRPEHLDSCEQLLLWAISQYKRENLPQENQQTPSFAV